MELGVHKIILILGILGISQAQKAPKHGQTGHNNGGGTGQAYPSHQSQYASNPNPYQGNYNIHGGGGNAVTAKPNYALLLSDSRTLNSDGTINFQYAADNGLQQGETVDPDGTRRGFYSYPGADGKPITVKYTAGKNGFVAEGDHLPKQPNVPAHSDKDEEAADYRGNSPQHGAGNYPSRGHSPQSYRPHQSPSPAPAYQGHGGEQGQYNHNQGQYSQGRSPPAPQYNPAGPPRYNSGGPTYQAHSLPRPIHSSPEGQDYRGISPAGFFGRDQGLDFGPANYGSPSHNSVNRYRPAAPVPQSPPRAFSGNPNIGQSYSAANPHQGPGGPYNGQFDLGNGGQFSINFNPGQSREVAVGGDYGRPPQDSPY